MKNKDENDNIIEHYNDIKLSTGNIMGIVGFVVVIICIIILAIINSRNYSMKDTMKERFPRFIGVIGIFAAVVCGVGCAMSIMSFSGN
jgi:hypothetical protein